MEFFSLCCSGAGFLKIYLQMNGWNVRMDAQPVETAMGPANFGSLP
jgi:hypothetical protein